VILWLYSAKTPADPWRGHGLLACATGIFRLLAELSAEARASLGYLAFGWLTMGPRCCRYR